MKGCLCEAENKAHPLGQQIQTGLQDILNWIKQTLKAVLLRSSQDGSMKATPQLVTH